jgi:hypothetical protein
MGESELQILPKRNWKDVNLVRIVEAAGPGDEPVEVKRRA